MSPHEYPMVRYGRILPHSLQGQKLMLLPLQSVECYTAYASADVIGRSISLMYQTVEVQRFAIDEMMKNGDCTVTVCPTTSSWHGVTYAQDKAYVKEAIADLIKNGEYPEKLWD